MALQTFIDGLRNAYWFIADHLLSLVFTLFGVLGVAIAGLVFASASLDAATHSASTMVTITDVIIAPDGDHEAGTCAVAFHYTVDGRSYLGSTGDYRSSTLCGFLIDDEVPAHYAPGNPSDIQLDEARGSRVLVGVLASGIPLLFGVIGVGLLVADLRQDRLHGRRAALADREPEEIVVSPPPVGSWEMYQPTEHAEDDPK